MKDTNLKKPQLAGGVFMAIGMLGGAIVGVVMGQPSAGMVMGLAIGSGAALITWFVNRGN
jgi:fucose permease